MSCYLRVMGERLHIDAFEQKTQMQWTVRGYAGESLNAVSKRKSKHSHLFIDTSKASFSEFKQQITDTISFLNDYKRNLAHIVDTPEIDFAFIDFGVLSVIDRQHLTQNFYLPPELIRICGELGIAIEISCYKPDMELILEEDLARKKKK